MHTPTASRRRHKSPPPGENGQEALYLQSLSQRQVPVIIKLRDGESVQGWIEYFDDCMIRLTRSGHPNLFIYKHQIRSISEVLRRAGRTGNSAAPDPAAELTPDAAPHSGAPDIPESRRTPRRAPRGFSR
jgi:host factor-I protein